MARTQAADYDLRRLAIVEAAAELYAQFGFLGASLVDLAERVPRLVRSLETLVTDWSRQGVILHAETLAVQAAHRARHLAIVLVPVWITAAALAMIAVTLLFGR